MLYAPSRALVVLSLYAKPVHYLPIDIISLSLRLPTLPILSSFLSLSRSAYALSFPYGHTHFLVSFSSFPHLLIQQGTGLLLFFLFLKIRFDGFLSFLELFSIMVYEYVTFYAKNAMYFDTISMFFNAFLFVHLGF